MNLPWARRASDAVEVTLTCGHVVLVRVEWIAADGRLISTISCTTDRCRRVHAGVVLEGWGP